MKPNFALDLTSDGIALLHRAGNAGWHVVGEVALASPSLGDDLAALRKKANTLDPSGMRTKLVIPDEQIRYLDIPAGSAPGGDHAAATADALDGATPYPLDELAYDWTVRGEKLYIAAVARETLDEAESFARDHKFNPVCFVADPDQELYAGEPFFGMTEAAQTGGPVERDTGPMTRLGALPSPDEIDEGQRAGDDAATQASSRLSFASVRAESGKPPTSAPRLEGAARITPSPLPDADARAITGAAQASLAPNTDVPALGPAPDKSASPRPPARTPAAPTAPTKADTAAPDRAATRPTNEAERLTIFGARSNSNAGRGKPRFLGLILTAALLLVLIAVATWAAVFPDSGLGRLLRGAEPQIAVTPDIPELESPDPQPPAEPAGPGPTSSEPGAPTPESSVDDPEIAALSDPGPAVADPGSTALPAPEEALAAPEAASIRDEPGTGDASDGWRAPRTPEEARQRYAATGIWPSAPEAPDEPRSESLETFYQTSIDEQVALGDAVALPGAQSLAPDLAPPRPAPPPPADRTFVLDARGFVRATPEGALTPEGTRVYSGSPPIRPPETPARAVPLPGLTPTEEAKEARESLSGIRPRLRPKTLIEEHERGAFGGRTRTELATLRPRSRPETINATAGNARETAREETTAAAAAIARATEEAVAESLKPRLRPKAIASGATPRRNASVAPTIPTSASIAKRATERNAINLRRVNLIGVYGSPSNRRALVRLSNGRYRKVQVGDRIDGGRVSAIGDAELRYTKSGRSVVLRMPRG